VKKRVFIYTLLLLGISGILCLQSYLLYNSFIQSKVLEENRLNNAIDGTIRDLAKQKIIDKYEQFTADSTYMFKDSSKVEINLMDITKDSVFPNQKIKTHQQSVIIKTDIQNSQINHKKLNIDSLTKKLLEEVRKRTNRKEEFSLPYFKSTLFQNLTEQQLDSSVAYCILDENNKKLYSTAGFDSSKSIIKKELYPGDIIADPVHIQIYTASNRSLLSQVLVPGALSLLFLLCCLWGFKWVFASYIKERKLSEVKTNFINSMSHELKTPLATIDLSIQNLMNTNTLEPKRTQLYEIIQTENHRMQKYIEHILQSVQISNQGYQLELESIDPNTWFKHTTERIEQSLIDQVNSIQVLQSLLSKELKIDCIHFENVLRNIIDNAIKYCTQKPEIKLQIRESKGFFSVSIQDNGIGISKADMPYIFDQFYRVTQGNIYSVQGTGIGLYYSKQIIALHQGTIDVKSELGKGSTFTISIPIS